MSASTPLDNDLRLQRMQEQNDNRMKAGAALVDAAAAADRARAEVATHDATLRTAYDAALKAGWTEPELRKAGLRKPSTRTSSSSSTPRPPAIPRVRPANDNRERTEQNSDTVTERGFAHTG